MDLILLIALVVGLTIYFNRTNPHKRPKTDYTNVKATPKDLNPATTIFMSASSKVRYLTSTDWTLKRATRLTMDDYTCQLCGSKDHLNVHHITYERLGCEDIDTDLITLCSSCHSALHERLGYDRVTDYPIQ